MTKNYFEVPTQVVFVDPDAEGNWLSGIAYRNEIICGCCGGVFEIEDVIDAAQADNLKCGIYAYGDWNNISDDIISDELPEGLRYDDGNYIIEDLGE